MNRLLLDTSVLLPGIVGRPTSPPAQLLVGMREGAGELLSCPTIICELRAGLAKPYFRQRIRPDEADEIAVAIELVAIMAPDPVDPPAILRAPTDDFLVGVARRSGRMNRSCPATGTCWTTLGSCHRRLTLVGRVPRWALT